MHLTLDVYNAMQILIKKDMVPDHFQPILGLNHSKFKTQEENLNHRN